MQGVRGHGSGGGPVRPEPRVDQGEGSAADDLVEAIYTRVFDPRGGTFTQTVLRHYAARGRLDPGRITPVVADIGEALVLKHSTDTGRLPDDDMLAAIVDQAILPAVGVDASERHRTWRADDDLRSR
ncbi:hypothetical protein [Micromonospora echinospora]|uniref:hypothetical protein n=1 Tax=Micromonospora echinospora TaxID=1877 RepID=UPI003A8B8631